MKRIIPLSMIFLMFLSCKNDVKTHEISAKEKTTTSVNSKKTKFNNHKSLQDTVMNQMFDLLGMDGESYSEVIKKDTLYNQLTNQDFITSLLNSDNNPEEISKLLHFMEVKDSLDIISKNAEENSATREEMLALQAKHKETLKQITGDADQVDEIFDMISSQRINRSLGLNNGTPVSHNQEQVRHKLEMDDVSYVEEKLTGYSLYNNINRKKAMEALAKAPKSKSDSIMADFFEVSIEESQLLKKLPATPKIFKETNAIAMRDYELDASISKHLASGKASNKFKTLIKKFTEKRTRLSRKYLEGSEKAREKFYELNPNWLGTKKSSEITYRSKNDFIYLPLGALSFADEVIYHNTGKYNRGSNKQGAIGEPDINKESVTRGSPKICNIGFNGVLTLAFLDNAIIDVNGPDLYVFEVGQVEPTNLELSKDGKKWIDIGKIDGGTAFIDIQDFVKKGDTYNYIRLTDLGTHSALPGADVDAVAAIGGVIRLNINSAVLFDTGSYVLKPSATPELNKLADQIAEFASGTITVEGHTDADGSTSSNKELSLKRAQEVSTFLQNKLPKKYTFKETGLGESQPIVPNDTPENKQKNRRVEILVSPSGS